MVRNGKMLSEQAVNEILEMITLKKRFKPGDKLPNENQLSEELGVSRTTLREGVRFLVAQNVLEIRRGKGTFVVDNDELSDDFEFKQLEHMELKLRDLYEMRYIFEPESAYYAAKRATEEEIREIVECEKLVEEKILQRVDCHKENIIFHDLIARATHNEFMIRLIPILNQAIEDSYKAIKLNLVVLEHTRKDHSMITEFLKEREADSVRLAMKLHLKHTIQDFHFEHE